MDTQEISRHCRRKTRGEYEVASRIEALILEFTGATDVFGVPLFTDKMIDIWGEQRKHVTCIQDPEGIPLYSQTGTVHKGNVVLPVYRCGRGRGQYLQKLESQLTEELDDMSDVN